jgi:hypothetical protein
MEITQAATSYNCSLAYVYVSALNTLPQHAAGDDARAAAGQKRPHDGLHQANTAKEPGHHLGYLQYSPVQAESNAQQGK